MNERIYTIIAKQFNGEANEEERRELDAWIAADARNRAHYEDMQLLWSESDEVLRDPIVDTDAAWNKVMAKTIEAAPAQKPAGKVAGFPAWGKYIGAVAAILLIGLIVWRPFSDTNTMMTVLADNGNREVILPDNSVVTLRAGSSISYPKSFESDARKVALNGEAFFKVTRDESKPFTIDADGVAEVKVLGTSFNVVCKENGASVVVATGKVQMTSIENKTKSVILTPGEAGVLQDNNLTETTVTDNNHMYWMTGALSFENQPLKNIIGEMSKLNKTTIKFVPEVPDAVKDQKITISFENQPLEEMLTELCMVSKCKWNKQDNSYFISTNDR